MDVEVQQPPRRYAEVSPRTGYVDVAAPSARYVEVFRRFPTAADRVLQVVVSGAGVLLGHLRRFRRVTAHAATGSVVAPAAVRRMRHLSVLAVGGGVVSITFSATKRFVVSAAGTTVVAPILRAIRRFTAEAAGTSYCGTGLQRIRLTGTEAAGTAAVAAASLKRTRLVARSGISIVAHSTLSAAMPGGAYDPATDASVIQWLRSDDLEEAPAGSAVPLWPAAKGVDALAGASAPPRLLVSQQNGRNAVQYTNSGGLRYHRTESAFGPIPQPYTVWAAFRIPEFSFNNCYLFDAFGASGGPHFRYSAPRWYVGAGTSLDAGKTPDLAWHLLRVTYDGANSSVAFDGVVTATGDAGTNALVGLTIGEAYGGGKSPNNNLGELIIQSGAPANESAIWAYLNERWATY